MNITQKGREFDLLIPSGSDLLLFETGNGWRKCILHPVLDRWITRMTDERAIVRVPNATRMFLVMPEEKVTEAERFLTLLKVMGAAALETLEIPDDRPERDS